MALKIAAALLLLVAAAAGFVVGTWFIYWPAAVLVGSGEAAAFAYALLLIERQERGR